MVRIGLDGISKYFGRVKAVDNLTVSINDSEFIALLGPSGCGKTTTLLIVAGIYKPTKGRVYFDEEDITDLPPKDRNIGMVFQSYALYPHMNVYNNIAFPLKLKKMPENEISKRVKEVARMLKIEELLERKPAQLSGGQQQRVALARALVKRPQVLLLDEPLSNLDALLRVYMRAEIKRLQNELGITTIYVTHDQVEALSMAHRIVVLNKGKVQQIGTPDEIYNSPRNTFVAGFIGTPPMNMLPCSLTEHEEGGILIKCEGVRLSLGEDLGSAIRSKTTSNEVLLGVRPEDIALAKNSEEAHAEGTIIVKEPLGRDVILTVGLGESSIKVILSPQEASTLDEKVKLRFDLNKVHLFDKKTGEALI